MSPFNSARYEALLKGLNCETVKFSDLERTQRIDAEYFQKPYLRTAQLLKKISTKSVVDCAGISDGNHFAISEDFVREGIPYYRGQDVVGHFFVEQSDPVHITEAAFLKPWMARSNLRKGDVLLSIIGTIGELSVVSSSTPATCSCKLAILRPKSVSPEYLATFLRSTHGRSQVERLTRGAVQMGILLEDMDQLRVARFSDVFEKAIAEVVQTAKSHFDASRKATDSSGLVLVDTLGLSEWRPPSNLTCIRRFAEVRASARMDAEHYREEFYAAILQIKRAGAIRFIPLDELLTTLTNGHTPLHHNLEEGDVPFLCAEHVSNFEVHYESDKRIHLKHHQLELARTALQNRDILLTIKGRVGNAAMVERLVGPANINQDVALLRLNDKLPPWFVLAFINSLFGQMQVKQLSTGGINPFLGLSNVRLLEIPEFEPKLMEQIARETNDLVRTARRHLEKARALLSRATAAVDIAVERHEAEAIDFISESR